MEKRKFGSTGLEITLLGLGTNHIGSSAIDDHTAGRFLNEALDLGINLIDTARSYDRAEERIGKFLSGRRKEFILSTKVGYDVQGERDWSYNAVYKGITEALKKLQTDHIDIVHLHSCEKEFLEKGEVIDALERAKKEGLTRFIAYSGENEALDFAVSCGKFDSFQASLNICDQRILVRQLPEMVSRNLGFIAKRPLANAPWRYSSAPVGHSHIEYFNRFNKMKPDPRGTDWDELALRFSAFSEGVGTCIAGTTSLEHLKRNIKAVGKGKLDGSIIKYFRESFKRNDEGWTGLI